MLTHQSQAEALLCNQINRVYLPKQEKQLPENANLATVDLNKREAKVSVVIGRGGGADRIARRCLVGRSKPKAASLSRMRGIRLTARDDHGT